MGTFALSLGFRFGSSVILSRLLSPELFGILLIILTVRQGIELSSDVGFGQNIVQNKLGDNPDFLNTVWVMQIARGVILGTLLFLCATPIATLYAVPAAGLQISAALLFVSGLASTSIFLLHRNLKFTRLNVFDLGLEGIGSLLVIAAAVASPTIESVLMAALAGQLIRSASSYFLTSDANRFHFSAKYAWEILIFGRWIFLLSILTFLSANFDRLFIGKVAPLAIFGIYGIAKALCDLPTSLVFRVGYSVIFPVVSSAKNAERPNVRVQLSAIRFKLLLVAAAGVAFGISISDIAVTLIYDDRYHDAAWMLSLLLFGAWLAILCSINEYAMLGFGKPSYIVISNGIKLAYYMTVLPLAYQKMEVFGAIIAISFSEIGRYVVISIGQRRENFSFLSQDLAATLVFIGLVTALSWARSAAGLGTAFDTVPMEHIGWMFGRPA